MIRNQAMEDSIVAWIEFVQKTGKGDNGELGEDQQKSIIRMLEVALEDAPNNPRALAVLADQVLKLLGDDEDNVVRMRLKSIEITAPGISHLVQVSAALMENDIETATMHRRIAAEIMPRSGAILNNLAVAISGRGDPSLEEALKISRMAIERTPNATPNFYETRGQILTRMGRYAEAIPDLERAFVIESLRASCHQSLATCYEELGDVNRGSRHREAATRTGNP